MNTQLSSIKKMPGERYDVVSRTEKIMELRELMQDQDLSLSNIAKHFNVALETASEWRKAAMVVIAKDDQGFSRDGLRHLQVGRINSRLGKLDRDLSTADTLDDRLKVHDRIIKYYDSLARITGLNIENVQHTVSMKPLNIVMPTLVTPIIEATPIDTQVLDDPKPTI